MKKPQFKVQLNVKRTLVAIYIPQSVSISLSLSAMASSNDDDELYQLLGGAKIRKGRTKYIKQERLQLIISLLDKHSSSFLKTAKKLAKENNDDCSKDRLNEIIFEHYSLMFISYCCCDKLNQGKKIYFFNGQQHQFNDNQVILNEIKICRTYKKIWCSLLFAVGIESNLRFYEMINDNLKSALVEVLKKVENKHGHKLLNNDDQKNEMNKFSYNDPSKLSLINCGITGTSNKIEFINYQQWINKHYDHSTLIGNHRGRGGPMDDSLHVRNTTDNKHLVLQPWVNRRQIIDHNLLNKRSMLFNKHLANANVHRAAVQQSINHIDKNIINTKNDLIRNARNINNLNDQQRKMTNRINKTIDNVQLLNVAQNGINNKVNINIQNITLLNENIKSVKTILNSKINENQIKQNMEMNQIKNQQIQMQNVLKQLQEEQKKNNVENDNENDDKNKKSKGKKRKRKRKRHRNSGSDKRHQNKRNKSKKDKKNAESEQKLTELVLRMNDGKYTNPSDLVNGIMNNVKVRWIVRVKCLKRQAFAILAYFSEFRLILELDWNTEYDNNHNNDWSKIKTGSIKPMEHFERYDLVKANSLQIVFATSFGFCHWLNRNYDYTEILKTKPLNPRRFTRWVAFRFKDKWDNFNHTEWNNLELIKSICDKVGEPIIECFFFDLPKDLRATYQIMNKVSKHFHETMITKLQHKNCDQYDYYDDNDDNSTVMTNSSTIISGSSIMDIDDNDNLLNVDLDLENDGIDDININNHNNFGNITMSFSDDSDNENINDKEEMEENNDESLQIDNGNANKKRRLNSK